MGEATKIEWAHHTWNPWRGCAHAKLPDGSEHPGCLNCYAEAMAPRNPKALGIWGEDGTRAIGVENYWMQPFKWNAAASKAGERHRVFFASLADVFEDREDLIPHRERAFNIIDQCQDLDFLILTKRPQNIRRMWPVKHDSQPIFPGMPGKLGEPQPCIVKNAPRSNVWLITSVSDQATADAMIPELLKCRDLCPVLGLSAEPLLGPIRLDSHAPGWLGSHACGIHWVIVGSESGHHARPMQIDWARSIVDQCRAAGVSCFVKQMATPEGRAAGDPKGGNPAFWPAGDWPREFPHA